MSTFFRAGSHSLVLDRQNQAWKPQRRGNPAIFLHFDSLNKPPTREISSRHKKRLLSRLIKQIVCDRFHSFGIFGFLFAHFEDHSRHRVAAEIGKFTDDFTTATPFLANERFSISRENF
jgi:hypothetical protein